MVRPPPKQQVPVVDTDLVSFINEYLFSPHHHVEGAAPSTPRYQRTPSRCKRYRSMWRSAAKSLIKKRYSSQETHLPSADQLFPPLSLDNGFSSQESLSADHLLRKMPSLASLQTVGDHAAIDSQQNTQNNGIRIDIDAEEDPPLSTPACSNSTLRGYDKVQPLETSSTHDTPKHSSRKPPRPPRAGLLRSGSHRAIRLKAAARRAMVDNARMKKQKLPKSTSNATSVWAFIITICFVSIMLLQGLWGNHSKDEGQLLSEGISSSSFNTGMPLPFMVSRSPSLVTERGGGKSFDRLQHSEASLDNLHHSEPKDSLFISLRRSRVRRLQATTHSLHGI